MKFPFKQLALIGVMAACSFGVYLAQGEFSPSDLDKLGGSPGVIVYQPPLQKAIDSNLYTFEESDIALVPVAIFDVTGVVLAKKRYLPWGDYSFAPWDMALGWGAMSDPSQIAHVEFWSAGRELHFNVAHDSPVQKPQILPNSANIHVIPASDEVKRQIGQIQKGDIIRMTGFLVNAVDGIDTYETSMHRNDTGKKSSEILYVESVDLSPL
jgi:hypothetical protein